MRHLAPTGIECDRVLLDVKARPSGWPSASLDPDSGRGPGSNQPEPTVRTNDKFRSLRFQGIANPHAESSGERD